MFADETFSDIEFDVVKCINQRFPKEHSLNGLDDYIANVRARIKEHDEKINQAVRGQTMVENDGKEALKNATCIIKKLQQRIHDMKAQAKKSEQTVNDITCDIKQLDNAKRNLTSAIIMINNLHILVESIEKLKILCDSEKNEYKQMATILEGIQDVMKQFQGYEAIPQIKSLSNSIDNLTKSLSERINNDFKSIFLLPSPKHSIPKEDAKLIAEACLVISLLDENVKSGIINWFLDLLLLQYSALFKDNHLQMSSLNGVDKRFNWFKKHLLEFEDKFGFLFPPPWQMNVKMAVEFCRRTEASLTRVMKTNPSEINMESLLFAMSKTTAFESLLEKRFCNDQPIKDLETQSFNGLISSCFEPFFYVFITTHEGIIQKLFESFIDEHQKAIKNTKAKKVARLFDSGGKLFTQYKNSLVECVQLSNKSILVDLHELFKRYLREYATKILQTHLKGFSQTAITPLSKITGTESKFSVGTSGLIPGFLRDDIHKSKIEPHEVCSVLLNADYCLETSQQLEKKLKEKVDPTYESRINLKTELDLFNDIIDGCIHLLIQYLEYGCENGFATMIKTQWSTVDSPSGHSAFVDEVTLFLQIQIPLIRDHLRECRKYFVQLCNKFIAVFTQKFISNLYRCKMLAQGGAEQLLLDTHILKNFLVNLPCINSDIKSAPTSYTKVAIQGMSKAEMILKVVLVPHDDIDFFVGSYYKLLPDSSISEFQRILDVKGVKKNETNTLIEAYKEYKV